MDKKDLLIILSGIGVASNAQSTSANIKGAMQVPATIIYNPELNTSYVVIERGSQTFIAKGSLDAFKAIDTDDFETIDLQSLEEAYSHSGGSIGSFSGN